MQYVEACLVMTLADRIIPRIIEIPCSDSKLLYGFDPLILSREDMTNDYAWYRLAVKHDPWLEERDFKSKDIFTMYFLLSLGLLEFPLQLIGGDPGGGKSLYEAWYTYQVHRLFGKVATLDWTPPEPEHYGKYNLLFDGDFIDKIIEGYNELSTIEKMTGRPAPREKIEQLVTFNSAFGLEECDSYAERGMQTNLTKLLSMVARRRRHTFTSMSMVLIDINRFAPIIYNLHSHKVNCIWEGHFKNTCSIMIQDARKGGTGISKWLWIQPRDWTHLWDSHNIPPLTHDINITFGNKPKKKKEEEELG